MQSNSILIQNISVNELQELIDQTIKQNLTAIKKGNTEFPDVEELLTRDETCQFLKIDSSTLWAWTNQGKVKSYGIGARRYYKKSELLECLILLKK